VQIYAGPKGARGGILSALHTLRSALSIWAPVCSRGPH
jgi:hypothetical protein